MRGSRSRSSFLLAVLLCAGIAGSAAAQCRYCDPFFHCVSSNVGGALVCLESPFSCGMVMPCLPHGGRADDSAAFLTTWTLFDGTVPMAVHALRPAPRGLSLGDEARGGPGAAVIAGALVDATIAHGHDYAIVLEDAAGDGFALRHAVEGAGVRIEVRDVRSHSVGALLASELLGERDELVVPVRAEGRDRVLALQAANLTAPAAPAELARLRRAMVDIARAVPLRPEPLFKVREP